MENVLDVPGSIDSLQPWYQLELKKQLTSIAAAAWTKDLPTSLKPNFTSTLTQKNIDQKQPQAASLGGSTLASVANLVKEVLIEQFYLKGDFLF